MRLLLDTHVLLWWLANDPTLGSEARAAIADPANEICVSLASVWEAAIKRTLGKLRFDDVDLVAALAAGGFRELPIAVEHALVSVRGLYESDESVIRQPLLKS